MMNFNPILTEIQGHMQALSPEAKDVVAKVGGNSLPTQTATNSVSAPSVLPPGSLLPRPSPGPEPAPITMGDQTPSISMPLPAPSLVTGPNRGQSMLTNGEQVPMGTTLGDTSERTRLINQGSGVSQIANKIENSTLGQNHPLLGKVLGGLAQGAATVGDTALSLVAPRTSSLIPGTTLHHQALLNNANNSLAQDYVNSKNQSQIASENAQTEKTNAETPEIAPNAESARGLQEAQVRHLNAESEGIENPQDTYSIHDTEAGPLFVNNKTGEAQHLSIDGQPVGPKVKLTQSQPIIGQDGKPHTYMIDEKGNKVADLGVHYERPMSVRVDTGARQDRNAVMKAYEPTLESAERMNVMTDAYEKAVKNHDQQAMLNLLANHLGMTMGLQKGSRLTKDIIHEAQQSQPWISSIGAKFDKDGYLSGVTLSPNQMRQMVELGQQRYIEDAKKSRALGSYIGARDDGPQRIPNQATVRYYTSLAKGNPAKAKQLAAQDGWSVQ